MEVIKSIQETLIVASLLIAMPALSGCTSQADTAKRDAAGAATNPTSETERAVEVVTVQPARETVGRRIRLSASAEAYEKTKLYSKVAGYLEWIGVDIGDSVRKGQVVARLLIPEMNDQVHIFNARLASARANQQNAMAELERAKADRELRKITYRRVAQVREEEPEVIPQQKVDEARQEFQVAEATVKVVESRIQQTRSTVREIEAELGHLKTLMEYAQIKAPFDGVVTQRYVDTGAFIQAAVSSRDTSPIVAVSRTDRLRIFIQVPEKEVSYLQVGDPAEVTFDAFPAMTIRGKVTRFASAVDPSTRTMTTEIDILNPKGVLAPGMYGEMTLMLEEHPNALTVPAGALHFEGDEEFVFVVEAGEARKTKVTAGIDDAVEVEILNGLAGDEEVIVASKVALSDGLRLNRVAGK